MTRSILRIPHLRKSVDKLHSIMLADVSARHIDSLIDRPNPEYTRPRELVYDQLSKINKQCNKRFGTPADLSTSSFRIYLWLAYISHEQNLERHNGALKEFSGLFIEHVKRKRTVCRKILIKMDFSGYLYRLRASKGSHVLQINEAFTHAPLQIKRAIISAVLSRRSSKRNRVIKTYTTGERYLQTTRLISGNPIANRISCLGEKYDLSTLYRKLNQEYFHDQLVQPRLVWSRRSSTRRLGYYHPEIHTIAVARRLDSKNIPRLLVEYILYHEMLHQYFGIQNHNGRRYAHTSAFRKAEEQFKHQKEAENLIKLI